MTMGDKAKEEDAGNAQAVAPERTGILTRESRSEKVHVLCTGRSERKWRELLNNPDFFSLSFFFLSSGCPVWMFF